MELIFLPFLFTACYITSLIIGLATAITGLLAYKKLKIQFSSLPRILRLYICACFIPFVIADNIVSIYMAIIYLLTRDENEITIHYMKTVIGASSQMIRYFFLFIIIERIIATKFLEIYKFSTKISLFWCLTIFTYGATIVQTGIGIIVVYIPSLFIYTQYIFWLMFTTQFITFLICAVLYFLNKRLYKLLAYQITLQKRYQIFENVKVLSFIFPLIFSFTLIAPFGTIFNLVGTFYFNTKIPLCVTHIFYNLPFFVVFIREMEFKSYATVIPEINTNTNNNNILPVLNAFGKELPVQLSSKIYFQQLQQQWK